MLFCALRAQQFDFHRGHAVKTAQNHEHQWALYTKYKQHPIQKYTHTYEGSDDMPAHLKTSILGSSLTIPINNGSMVLGNWQGIYLCEHRNIASRRILVLTINGGN